MTGGDPLVFALYVNKLICFTKYCHVLLTSRECSVAHRQEQNVLTIGYTVFIRETILCKNVSWKFKIQTWNLAHWVFSTWGQRVPSFKRIGQVFTEIWKFSQMTFYNEWKDGEIQVWPNLWSDKKSCNEFNPSWGATFPILTKKRILDISEPSHFWDFGVQLGSIEARSRTPDLPQ